MNTKNYEVNVLVNGKPIREFYHEGKFYIEARQNTTYSIKLKNHGHKKIMAVLSVDGIDVLKGKNATEAESGYIINPYSTTEIKGYRIDDDNVATFKFDDGKTSYSTQVEQKFNPEKIEKVKKGEIAPSKNNGVIGVRIWEEKESMEIPTWQTAKNNYKGNFYGSYHLNGNNNSINFSAYSNLSGYMGSFSGCISSGSMISVTGCMINTSASNVSLFQGTLSPDTDTSTIDWNEWEVEIPLTNVNQFGELAAIDNVNLQLPKLKRRVRTLYQSDALFVSNAIPEGKIEGFIPNFSLGTAWGKQEEDKVVKVNFIKADTFIDLELFYLERVELIKLGIDLENAKKVFISGYPKAFENKDEQYCKTPTNWRKA